MNLIQTLEQEEIARLGKTIPDFAPGDVRRAKLYYLRDRSGKSARIKEKLAFSQKTIDKQAAAAAAAAAAK